MNLNIKEIKDSGSLTRERVVIKASQDCDLGKFLIALSHTINDSEFSASIQNVFWFPDMSVKKDATIVVYTKIGEPTTKLNDDGTTTYFFYWGLGNTLASIEDACVVLLNAQWNIKKVPLPIKEIE